MRISREESIARDEASRSLRFALPIFFWLAAVGAGVFLYGSEPRERRVAPFCAFYKVTGLYCPGCGALRAGHDLLHGRLAAALDHNAFAVAAAPFMVFGFGAWTLHRWRGQSGVARRYLPGWAGYSLAAAVIGFAVLRNLPMWPFVILAP